MIDIANIKTSILPIGVKPGQVVLFVDLTEIPKPLEAIETLKAMGYEPQLQFCEFASGLHIVAVLKNEQLDQPIEDDYLADERLQLGEQFTQNAVRLWRGRKYTPVAA